MSPVFGLRYLEDREVLKASMSSDVSILNRDGSGSTATGCDDADQIVP